MSVDSIVLYYRTEARFIDLGAIGPEQGVTVSQEKAKALMKNDNNFFVKKIEEAKVSKKKVTKNE